jgi:hypothetical protein
LQSFYNLLISTQKCALVSRGQPPTGTTKFPLSLVCVPMLVSFFPYTPPIGSPSESLFLGRLQRANALGRFFYRPNTQLFSITAYKQRKTPLTLYYSLPDRRGGQLFIFILFYVIIEDIRAALAHSTDLLSGVFLYVNH